MPSVVVLDASAAIELLLRSPTGDQVEARLRGQKAVVPAHFDAEVFSALGRLVRAGAVEESWMSVMLLELARAPFARYSLPPLLAPAWELRHNLSLRDALYVALARALEGRILTGDARLARAPGLGVEVMLVGPAEP